MTGVGTKYLLPWCCCLNLASNVSSVAWGKLRRGNKKTNKQKNPQTINGHLQPHKKMNSHFLMIFLLALLIQQVKQTSGLLADEMNTANIVCVVDVVPGNSFRLVFLLNEARQDSGGEMI